MHSSTKRPRPGSTYMSDAQKASYLDSIRSSQVPRPSGSRPFPTVQRTGRGLPASHSSSTETHAPRLESTSLATNSTPDLTQLRSRSPSHRHLFAGRPIARSPSNPNDLPARTNEAPVPAKPGWTYVERGTRWMERQEVASLRSALEDMDQKQQEQEGDVERRIHAAAQDEAAELVWRHRHPGQAEKQAEAPYLNPDLGLGTDGRRRDYHAHLRKGSYGRVHNLEEIHAGLSGRKVSGGSNSSSEGETNPDGNVPAVTARKVSPPTAIFTNFKVRAPSGKSYGGLAEAVDADIARAFRRSSSGGNKRIMSGEKRMFMHRNDKIWEDHPEQETPTEVQPEPVKAAAASVQLPSYVRKNPFARVRAQQQRPPGLEHSTSAPVLPIAKHDSVEIQRNAPSQSRKACYTSNTPAASIGSAGNMDEGRESPEVPMKDGKEIRSNEIRAATSKQRKDRSPNLPQPTVVSDKPGRPIVSFKPDWAPKEVVLVPAQTVDDASEPRKASRDSFRSPSIITPEVHVSADATGPSSVPTIVAPGTSGIPTIVLPEEPCFTDTGVQSAPPTPALFVEPPSIEISAPNAPSANSRPVQRTLPSPHRPGLPRHAATSPLPKSTPHYTPSGRASGTLCAHCALPIAGRILSAAGERFHPQCFVCHQCQTNLECVAFYPEPEKQRNERLGRIEARLAGLHTPPAEGQTEEELLQQELADGDASLRFYCHLDFHELFSPRCKSCKTPIEGEVIVACGAEWHAGHFFCAQCGDPFDATMPFVEKDGYAWCVGCHTNRYSPKCRGCRKPVTNVVVKALGADWHAACFVCVECKSEFEDGRYFLRGESSDPVCVKCEERRLKA